jgi:hypothetical protein
MKNLMLLGTILSTKNIGWIQNDAHIYVDILNKKSLYICGLATHNNKLICSLHEEACELMA